MRELMWKILSLFNIVLLIARGVPFHNKAVKERILEKGIVRFNDVSVFIGYTDFKTVIVKVYEAPPEMPHTAVIGRLSHYGRVLSFQRDYGGATRVLNGIRTVRLSLAIPSSGELLFVCYPSQPKTCQRCGEEGHIAQGAKNCVASIATCVSSPTIMSRLVWPFLLSPNFSGSVECFVFDSNGRILSLLFVFSSLSKLNIVNIYAPNLVSDRKAFFEQLHDFFFLRAIT